MAEIKVPIQINLPDDWVEQIIERLRNDPEAEWVEIIRCKDCENYQTDWETSYPNRHYCAIMDSMMPEDGFCNHAERRTDIP